MILKDGRALAHRKIELYAAEAARVCLRERNLEGEKL
jgi:hypothetical protein